MIVSRGRQRSMIPHSHRMKFDMIAALPNQSYDRLLRYASETRCFGRIGIRGVIINAAISF